MKNKPTPSRAQRAEDRYQRRVKEAEEQIGLPCVSPERIDTKQGRVKIAKAWEAAARFDEALRHTCEYNRMLVTYDLVDDEGEPLFDTDTLAKALAVAIREMNVASEQADMRALYLRQTHVLMLSEALCECARLDVEEMKSIREPKLDRYEVN